MPTQESKTPFDPEPPATTDDNVSVTEVAEEIELDMDSKDKRKRKFF
jgi:hypothetical protein